MQGSLPQTRRSDPDVQHKVLLVDDDAVSLEILTLMLGFDGHQVLSAVDGESALALLTHTDSTVAPDVLLVDMQMPGISGHELVRRVRTMEGPRPLLLGMSATALTTQQLRGFDGFLLKPLDLNDLRAALGPSTNAASARRKSAENGTNPEPLAKSFKTMASKRDRRIAEKETALGAIPTVFRHGSKEDFDGKEFEGQQTINPVVLNKLRNAMAVESLKELYAACLKDSHWRATTLQTLALEGRMGEIPPQAHQIKGAASMVGADCIASLAAKLELGSYKKEDTLKLINDLLNACEQLGRMLLAGKLDQSL